MRILTLDIETSPNEAFVWGLFNENIPLARLRASGYTLCWAAKWYGEKEVMFDSIYKSGEQKMLKRIHKLMEEADAIVHYNGTRFDVPTLNREFIIHGMLPPAPSKQIDLLRTARSQFRFVSNKLEYVVEALGIGKKTSVAFEDWVKCLEGDPKAWAKMEKYNKQDVRLTEKLYDEFKPWIKNHPNHSLYGTEGLVCPNCGGHHHQRRGYTYTKAGKYQRLQCTDCGAWFRAGINSAPKHMDRYTAI